MRIYPGSLRNFDDILRLNDASFSGVERPPADTLRRMIMFNDLWIAREVEQILGYALVQPDGLQAQDSYLWQIAVEPEYRRRGIAGNILHQLYGHYKFVDKKKTMSLHVHPANTSQSLYLAQGFKVVEIAKNTTWILTAC
jgi:ribosomal protein S18 acetylase RimI-like enzyme